MIEAGGETNPNASLPSFARLPENRRCQAPACRLSWIRSNTRQIGSDETAVHAPRGRARLPRNPQRLKGHTVWPEKDFPRTNSLQPKRDEMLRMLETRAQADAAGKTGTPTRV